MSTPTSLPLGERLAEHVGHRAARLQQGYGRDDARAVAELAILRRGAAMQPGADVQLIALTFAGLYDNPAALPDDGPTPAERAAYTALTLFAVHQQSRRGAQMHRLGYSMGRSARLLGKHSHTEQAVRARFTALATATTWAETVHHARGLVQQLRAHGIPLDYGQFARDLLDLQYPGSAERVRLIWGRHFYRVTHAVDDADPDETTDAIDEDIDTAVEDR